MVFEFEYIWAIVLIFVMERICCLQDQYEKDLMSLPDSQRYVDILTSSHFEDFLNLDIDLKHSFMRLSRMMSIIMMTSFVYLCNICLWFISIKKPSPQTISTQTQLCFAVLINP